MQGDALAPLCLTRSAFRLRSAKRKSQGFVNQLSLFVDVDFVISVVVDFINVVVFVFLLFATSLFPR